MDPNEDGANTDKKRRKKRTKKEDQVALLGEKDTVPASNGNAGQKFERVNFGQPGPFNFGGSSMMSAISQSLLASGINQEDIRRAYESLSLKDTYGFLSDPTSRLINAIETLRDCVQTVSGGKDAEKNKIEEEESEEEEEQPIEIETTKSGKRKVQLKVVFLKVSDISTVSEVFVAELFLQSRWHEPLLNSVPADDLKDIKPTEYWNPTLLLDNMLSETKDNSSIVAERVGKETWMIERRRVKGVFMQPLELKDFPFDVQDLTVNVTSEHDVKLLELDLDDSEPCMVHEKTAIEQQEWKIHEHVRTDKKVITQDFGQIAREKPALSFVCRSSRIPGYFYWNVFLIMFLITALSFATFALPTKTSFSRVVLTFTLFLTSVTFKIVINQSLPKISYLTSLDIYVLISMSTIVILSAWHCLVAVNSSGGPVMPTLVLTNEGYFCILFFIIYFSIHIVFIAWVYAKVCARRRQVARDDREFRVWLKKKLDWQNKQQAQAAADKANKKKKRRE